MPLNTRPDGIDDPTISRALDDIRKRAVEAGLLQNAVEVLDVQLSTSDVVRVAHKLGRKVRGYFISRVRSTPGAAFSVFDELSQNTDTDRYLYLRAVGAAPRVDLVVY